MEGWFEQLLSTGRAYLRNRRERGASMALALLLFLVCALLMSIVLSAATGAAGRSIGLTERDQNYYSAVSAAEMLKNGIESEEAVLECSKSSAGNVTLEVHRPSQEPVSIPFNTEISTIGDFSHGELTALSFLCYTSQDATEDSNPELLSMKTPSNFSSIWNALTGFYENSFVPSSNGVVSHYKLSNTVTSSLPSGVDSTTWNKLLNVSVEQKTHSDGSFDLTVTSGEKDTEKYSARLVCDADVDITDIKEHLESSTDAKKLIKMKWHVTQLYKTEA